jgi:exodeoxyribonuclease VII small subunit
MNQTTQAPASPLPSGTDTCSFEVNLEKLERVLADLEKGDMPLEEQLRLFESGVALSRTCLQKLESVEKRVEQLVVNAEGDLDSKPWEDNAEV